MTVIDIAGLILFGAVVGFCVGYILGKGDGVDEALFKDDGRCRCPECFGVYCGND